MQRFADGVAVFIKRKAFRFIRIGNFNHNFLDSNPPAFKKYRGIFSAFNRIGRKFTGCGFAEYRRQSIAIFTGRVDGIVFVPVIQYSNIIVGSHIFKRENNFFSFCISGFIYGKIRRIGVSRNGKRSFLIFIPPLTEQYSDIIFRLKILCYIGKLIRGAVDCGAAVALLAGRRINIVLISFVHN